MPKTKAFIEEVVESAQDFRLRRVKQMLNEINEVGEVIKEWKVLRESGD
jgi:hypothetical protein